MSDRPEVYKKPMKDMVPDGAKIAEPINCAGGPETVGAWEESKWIGLNKQLAAESAEKELIGKVRGMWEKQMDSEDVISVPVYKELDGMDTIKFKEDRTDCYVITGRSFDRDGNMMIKCRPFNTRPNAPEVEGIVEELESL